MNTQTKIYWETTADQMKSGDTVQIANCIGRFSRMVWTLNVRNASDGCNIELRVVPTYRANSRDARVPRNRRVRIYNREGITK